MTNWNKKYEEDFSKRGTQRFFTNLKRYNAGGNVSKGYQSQIKDFNRAAPKLLGGSSYGKYLDDPGNKSNALALATSLKQNGFEDKSVLDSMNSVLDKAESRRKKQMADDQKAIESPDAMDDVKKGTNFLGAVGDIGGKYAKLAWDTSKAGKVLNEPLDKLGDIWKGTGVVVGATANTLAPEQFKNFDDRSINLGGDTLKWTLDKLQRMSQGSDNAALGAQQRQRETYQNRQKTPGDHPQLAPLKTNTMDVGIDASLKDWKDGFSNRKRTTGIDVWRDAADNDGVDDWKDNKWSAAIGGLGGSILRDPLSYLGAGVARRGVQGGFKVSNLLSKVTKEGRAVAAAKDASEALHVKNSKVLADTIAERRIPKNTFKDSNPDLHESLLNAGANAKGQGNFLNDPNVWYKVISNNGAKRPLTGAIDIGQNVKKQEEIIHALGKYYDDTALTQASGNFGSKLIKSEIGTVNKDIPDFNKIHDITQKRYAEVKAKAGESSFLTDAAKITGKKESEIVDQLDFNSVKGALKSNKDRETRISEGNVRTSGNNSYSKYRESVRKENKAREFKNEPQVKTLSLSEWTSQPKNFDDAMGDTFKNSGLSASERAAVPRTVRDSLYGKGGFIKNQEFVDTNAAAKSARESALKHQKDADKLHAEIKKAKTSGSSYDVQAAQAKINVLESKSKSLWKSHKVMQEKASSIETNATIQHVKELIASKKGGGVASKNPARTQQLTSLKKLAEQNIGKKKGDAPLPEKGGDRYTREEAMSDKPELASEKKQAEKESSDSTRIDSEKNDVYFDPKDDKDFNINHPKTEITQDYVLSNPEAALEKINKELKELESPVGSFISEAGPTPAFFKDADGGIDVSRIIASEENPNNLLGWDKGKHEMYVQTKLYQKEFDHVLTKEEKDWANSLADHANSAVAEKVNVNLKDVDYKREVIDNLPSTGDGTLNAQQRMERLKEQPYPTEPSDANNGLWTPEEVSIINADKLGTLNYRPVPGSDEGMSFAIKGNGGRKHILYSERKLGEYMTRHNLIDSADEVRSAAHKDVLDHIVNVELKNGTSALDAAPVGKQTLQTRQEIIDFYEKKSRAAKTKEDLHTAQAGRKQGLEDHANGKPHDVGTETTQDKGIRRHKLEQEELNKALHTFTINNRTEILETLKTARDAGLAAPSDIKYGAAWLYKNHKSVRGIIGPEYVAFNRRIAKESGMPFAELRDVRNRALAYNDRSLVAQTKGEWPSAFNYRFEEGVTRNEFMKQFFQGKDSLYDLFHAGPFSLRFTSKGKKFASHGDVIKTKLGPFPADEGKDAIRIWKSERVKLVKQYTEALDEAIKADPVAAIKFAKEAWNSVPTASKLSSEAAQEAADAAKKSGILDLKNKIVADKKAADRVKPIDSIANSVELKATAEDAISDIVNGTNKLENAPTADTISIPRPEVPIKDHVIAVKESSRKEFAREAEKLRKELRDAEKEVKAFKAIDEPTAADRLKFKTDESAVINAQNKYRELRDKFDDVKNSLDVAARNAEKAQMQFQKNLAEQGLYKVLQRSKDPERVGIALRVLSKDLFVIPGTEQLLAAGKYASSMPVLNEITAAYNKLLRPMEHSLSSQGKDLRARGMSVSANHISIITKDLRKQFVKMPKKDRKVAYDNFLSKPREEWGDAEKMIDSQFKRIADVIKNEEFFGTKLQIDDFTHFLGDSFGVTTKAKKEFFREIKGNSDNYSRAFAKMIGTGQKAKGDWTSDPFRVLWASNVSIEQAAGLKSLHQGIGHGFGVRKHATLGKHDVTGDAAIKELERQGYKPVKGMDNDFLFSPDVMPEVQKLVSMFDIHNVSKTMRGFDSITRVWKQAVTIYNPGYYVRNFIGEVMTGMMGGVYDPIHYVRSRNILKYMKKNEDNFPELLKRDAHKWLKENTEDTSKILFKMSNGETLTQRESIALYYDSGLKSGLISNDFIDPEKSLGHITGGTLNQTRKSAHQKVQNFGEWNEDFPRMAHFLHAMQNAPKGMNKQARAAYARDEVIKHHFDYSDITQFEKTYLMRVVPFYKWTRKAVPLIAEMYFKRPGIIGSYNKVMNTISSGMDEEYARNHKTGQLPEYDEDTPDYVKQMMGYPLGKDKHGQQTYFNIQSPQTDALQALLDPVGNVALNMMNPFFKMPYEQARGKPLGGFDFGRMHGKKDRIRALAAGTPASKYIHKAVTRKDNAFLEDAPKGGWNIKGKRMDETSLSFWAGMGFNEAPINYEKKNKKMVKDIKRNRLEGALDTIKFNDANGDFDFDKFARAYPNDSQWTKDLVKYNNPDGTFNLRQKLKDMGNPKWQFVPEVVPQTDPTKEMVRKSEIKRTMKNAAHLNSELKYDYNDPKNDTPERRKREARLKKQFDDFMDKNYSAPII